GPLAYNRPSEATISQGFPTDQPYSQPFWLEKPKQGDTYTIDRQQLIGVPDAPPLLHARFQIAAGSERLSIERPVLHRYVDRVWGELVRPLIVVPPVAVNMPEGVLMFPNATRRGIHIQVLGNAPGAGELRVEAPA